MRSETLQHFYKLVKQELGVCRSAGSLRVELHREPRLALVAYALVRAIVHVREERLPVGAKRVVIYSKAVILACDEALVCSGHAHRLIVAAVAIFKFVGLGSSSFGEQLVAHADAKDRLVAQAHGATEILYSLAAHVRIARSVADEDTIVVELSVIVVPWHTHHLNPTLDEASENVALHATVDQHDSFLSTLVVAYYLLARNLVNIVDR